MITALYLTAAVLVIGAGYFLGRRLLRLYETFNNSQVIICPETKKQAMVGVDARRAVLTSLIGRPDIRLESCWRWPLRADCGQECLAQLDVASPDCLVHGVLMKWYTGKQCAFCRRVFDELHLIDHQPALLTPEGTGIEWGQVLLPNLMDVLATHKPVCWNCHIAHLFYVEHPDLVVDRTYSQASSSHRASATR